MKTIIEVESSLALQSGTVIEHEGGYLLTINQPASDSDSAEPSTPAVYAQTLYPGEGFAVVDGAPPDARPGHWCRIGDEWVAAVPFDPADLTALQKQLEASVDSAGAAIYARWTRFDVEYVQREAAARQFVAGGYQGDPGRLVTSFSDEAGLDMQTAADRIILQADTLHSAVVDLGALRMRKYRILRATTLSGAQAAHDAILEDFRTFERNLIEELG